MSSSNETLRDCLAPAKLNLFLHITGRRPDGYHSLQTVFQLLDWGDHLHFRRRDDGVIMRKTDVPGVPEEHDLVVRAARLLQHHTRTKFGAEIEIDKRLPMGAGLGGGSSDAATTLLALNRLWGVDLSREILQNLGLQLGADVPFFVFGQNAFAEGVGEALQAVDLPKRFFLVVTPDAHVPTAAIFSEKSLTRDTKVVTMMDFLAQQRSDTNWPDSFGRNDMQAVVAGKYAEVAKVLEWFSNLAPARMTGSGASVFAAFASRAEAEMAQAKLPASWKSVVTASLDSHPLFAFAS
ncbi:MULTISPECIES: 4-(cytidine 5'-diphospho)-2-C-methyl-D-erythritol kinase [Caballeronia]|jgi:4-diphosphocytidyl-2-C-methyl-D-erythritol kinase|uniref:4-(cytidine 5'-diphospho)-2-C-methyl-D-erythritol kinase n=1 Tax=Caballeronia TaxID=1827195 RepID=UPI00025BC590|nr:MULTISPECIES: 4-(cytidine 5'-diphospho)-2-C-methyl-D-erythritol kinase [Caballeronia]EKS68857.1 4-diphosphocytidyl-2-C-methyl-D-erythritol kinase [Burkholderia sp. SJ98]MCG7399441.1 4-(cytidine 5'-diphospho)-2-C-methyl-D-erythritol kinase [Caballeronia zhejiangensis]MDR5764062.1 4-(cytidine 5'-diphospho)-2-C-methyl-D-erythritol kinase [Caballeronia sp. LZ028]MDR5785687.1 4-(cytidine 5'-diphospho)-2-C-methyl-D-erythritol kinase [Caballeronia sp. LP003]MDR5791972.1 4-(cytidine 5'-diphospho)-2